MSRFDPFLSVWRIAKILPKLGQIGLSEALANELQDGALHPMQGYSRADHSMISCAGNQQQHSSEMLAFPGELASLLRHRWGDRPSRYPAPPAANRERTALRMISSGAPSE
jgi:hypothetical protein